MAARRLLILGGTAEAVALARGVYARFDDTLEVTTSLAGRTQSPAPLPGQVRIGGFGGPAGLAAYLAEHAVDRLIDATHPFATRIASEARIACDRAGVPRLLLLRPPWQRQTGDRWIEVADMPAAAAVVADAGRRAWLTVGSRELACFSDVSGVHFSSVSSIRRPGLCRFAPRGYPGARPVYPLQSAVCSSAILDVLVSKASGGAATVAKLVAARELGLPVIMVRRPPAEPGEAVETVEAALDWLAGPHRVPEPRRVS